MRVVKEETAVLFLDMAAAYNREGLPLPPDAEPEFIMAHQLVLDPALVARLADEDAEDMLLDLYVARRKWMQ